MHRIIPSRTTMAIRLPSLVKRNVTFSASNVRDLPKNKSRIQRCSTSISGVETMTGTTEGDRIRCGEDQLASQIATKRRKLRIVNGSPIRDHLYRLSRGPLNTVADSR